MKLLLNQQVDLPCKTKLLLRNIRKTETYELGHVQYMFGAVMDYL